MLSNGPKKTPKPLLSPEQQSVGQWNKIQRIKVVVFKVVYVCINIYVCIYTVCVYVYMQREREIYHFHPCSSNWNELAFLDIMLYLREKAWVPALNPLELLGLEKQAQW